MSMFMGLGLRQSEGLAALANNHQTSRLTSMVCSSIWVTNSPVSGSNDETTEVVVVEGVGAGSSAEAALTTKATPRQVPRAITQMLATFFTARQ